MSDYAFVTLLTSDSYLPGALTCIHSLKDAEGDIPANDFDTVCLVTPSTVAVESIKQLRKVFSLVVGVDVIESQSHKELALLGEPSLAVSIHRRLIVWQDDLILKRR
jgi:glycogenin glucosyltransferase